MPRGGTEVTGAELINVIDLGRRMERGHSERHSEGGETARVGRMRSTGGSMRCTVQADGSVSLSVRPDALPQPSIIIFCHVGSPSSGILVIVEAAR
jgi:hypothetical protein